jgi:hypothetical protein
MDRVQNIATNSSSTVACVSNAAGIGLPSRYLAIAISSRFTVLAFSRHITILISVLFVRSEALQFLFLLTTLQF